MIDALETVIQLIHQNLSDTVGERVASRHQFGARLTMNAWPTPAKAIQITYDTGGTADIHSSVQTPRLSAQCYGADEVEASEVYNALVGLTRTAARVIVETSQGNAFLYWLLLDGSPQSLRDTDIQPPVDYVQIYLTARVAEIATS